MENREKDKVSRNDGPTDAGDINRDAESRRGQEKHDSDVEFGHKIGKSENLESNSRNFPRKETEH